MRKKINIYFLFVLFGAMLWGTAGVFVRLLGNAFSSQMSLVFNRCFFAAIILGLIILFKDKKLFKIKLKDLWIFLSAAFFSIILFNYSYFKTMSLTSLSVAAVLLYTAPFFVVIISACLFGQSITVKKLLSLCIAFLGCCFVSGVFDKSNKITTQALVFGLITGFGYALYTIFSQMLIDKGYDTLTITFYTFLFAMVGSIPICNIGDTLKITFGTPRITLIILLMAIFNTVLPYIFYTAGLKGVEASIAPIIATVEPVVATFVGAVIFKEPITLSGIFGIVLVLLSVIILNLRVKSVEN